MNVNVHKTNPYRKQQSTQQAVVYSPDQHEFNLILLRLPPIALRVLFYALVFVEEDGVVELSPVAMAKVFQTHSTYVSAGVRALVRFNFIARKTRSTFWLSPAVAQPITIQVG